MRTPLNGKPTTIGVFGAIGEAYIARAFLESRGIHCFIKEEMVRSYYYAMTDFLEGTELQVGQYDALKARTLLIRHGYVIEEVPNHSVLMLHLEKFTAKIPLIKNWKFEQRVMATFAVVLILLAGMAALIFRNTIFY
ncbi:hypothetical protein O3Q51_08750 [Cryomorphaceae bacterium 1068]|nr:hypothetical protein [Cryomorphaceae bacterium 1068]